MKSFFQHVFLMSTSFRLVHGGAPYAGLPLLLCSDWTGVDFTPCLNHLDFDTQARICTEQEKPRTTCSDQRPALTTAESLAGGHGAETESCPDCGAAQWRCLQDGRIWPLLGQILLCIFLLTIFIFSISITEKINFSVQLGPSWRWTQIKTNPFQMTWADARCETLNIYRTRLYFNVRKSF